MKNLKLLLFLNLKLRFIINKKAPYLRGDTYFYEHFTKGKIATNVVVE